MFCPAVCLTRKIRCASTSEKLGKTFAKHFAYTAAEEPKTDAAFLRCRRRRSVMLCSDK